MNLALFDPFKRQLPDRIDSTIKLPTHLHPPELNELDHLDYATCFAVSFNRHGTYLASGYGSGVLPIHDFASRTLSAIVIPPTQTMYKNGITQISWSKNSKRILIGSFGDSHISFVDNQHELGTEDVIRRITNEENNSSNLHPSNKKQKKYRGNDNMDVEMNSTFNMDVDMPTEPSTYRVLQNPKEIKVGDCTQIYSSPSSTGSPIHYQQILFPLSDLVGLSSQIHPSGRGGMACLKNGSLILFSLPSIDPFHKSHQLNSDSSGYYTYLCNPQHSGDGDTKAFYVVSASFDSKGNTIYAVTQCGKFVGFRLDDDLLIAMNLSSTSHVVTDNNIGSVPRSCRFTRLFQKHFAAELPGKAISYQVVISRKGSMALLNCKDGSLRLYDLKECWSSETDVKAKQTFQDPISKCKWTSCDFSGDGEYVVAGCNNVAAGNRYELYFWNTVTGILMDQLQGPQVSINDLSWHPTRSFVAVATSDGLLDLWGPRIDWTAFAPDFQALQANVEYIEKEDEFDIVVDGDVDEENKRLQLLDQLEEQTVVDVCKIDNLEYYSSDEDEDDNLFHFVSTVRSTIKR